MKKLTFISILTGILMSSVSCEKVTEIEGPELEHGQNVVLQGEVTRGNEMSNTMGFSYQGHILTCYPESGSIVHFKPSLFLQCRIYGSITRLDEKGYLNSKKPKIIFLWGYISK